MSEIGSRFYRLNQVSVIDICGSDALAIINNLTTNEVEDLDIGQGRETFITDVRGKTVGHACLYRQADFIRLIGPAGQTDRIAQHVDRYTIREDASPASRDGDFAAIVLAKQAASIAGIDSEQDEPIGLTTIQLGNHQVSAYRTRWLGEQTVVLLTPIAETDSAVDSLCDLGLLAGNESEFHASRINAAFPWYGIDLNESNLPQELDRDAKAISFTKGCYLGQETVARLDAMGQVQRKLVRWSIQGSIPRSGAIVSDGEKAVGRLTSISAISDGEAIALGFARRTHFEAGARANGKDTDSGVDFTATVV
jgi:folate-binding protein YgfZ